MGGSRLCGGGGGGDASSADHAGTRCPSEGSGLRHAKRVETDALRDPLLYVSVDGYLLEVRDDIDLLR